MNIVRELAAFHSKYSDIFIKISKSLGFKTILGRDEGYFRAPG
jgi:hypothetical protein